ncbi:DUF937 domain-containing protein [Gordonia desulfuricans]|uniref:DUF937 domain-containing protein n=1 Tax=Gordonia desulfuricans TaxID=89051 RepID=A0A7K3LUP4_9ACTN|nr:MULTISPECIES: DUF937 domain-containing protein [Gordonia]EMP14757.1 hypothetical protein ISGA_1910 [Gordonia sp. NB41Y]NDK91964.1 DUF937 domain-containing protein [Gordonia desulfuricans]WLP92806.1 DUF937 domain-containing protein [Gordonia sp. NB41Y]
MSDLDDLMSRLPIGDIAGRLGVDEATAQSAVAQTLPALLGGMAHQADQAGGAEGLANALAGHQNDLAQGQIDLGAVDTGDGQKIVSHVFGGETENVATALSGQVPAAAVDSGLIQKLLPILAPIVMSYLAGKVMKGSGTGGGTGDLGSILGNVLGGAGGGGLGSILGNVLGGSGGGKSGGGLGDLLGGILGGKK